jgi:hypothetical protein
MADSTRGLHAADDAHSLGEYMKLYGNDNEQSKMFHCQLVAGQTHLRGLIDVILI